MEEYKLKIKDIKNVDNNLKLNLSIYDSNLPSFTTGSQIVPAVIDGMTGSIIIPETIEMIQIPRPELIKNINISLNTPIDYIEAQIKKEIENFKLGEIDIKEKIEYFKDKVY